MKSLQWLIGSFFLMVLDLTAVGQANPAPTTYPPGGGIAASMISSPSIGGAAHGVDSIKGSPFSAEVEYEFTQALADENRIRRESRGKIFRDAEGRIRSEFEDEVPQRTRMLPITIDDPVSQTFVRLYPQTKRAVVNHIAMHTNGAARETGVGSGAESSRATGVRSPQELLEELKALQQAKGLAPGATEQNPTRLKIGRPREELGTREIEGFRASGIRYSNTIPAGQIGNEKPIVTVNETWWSEKLKAVLVSIYDDPESGRRVTRLTNIQVGEPDSQLFQIPPDYTVQEFPPKSKTVANQPE